MPDFIVIDHGTIYTFQPLTQEAKDWIEENVQAEDWQYVGPKLGVDHRYARPIIAGILDAGLSVGGAS